jgi:hypothetical protein
MRNKRFFLLLLIIVLTAGGCKKYDEGPALSLRSKKARVVGKWVTEYWLVNKYEQVFMIDTNRTAEFTKEGIYRYHEYNPFTHNTKDLEGTWEFRNQKEQLLLSLPGNADTSVYQIWDILRLKNNELRLEMVEYGFPNSVLYEWRLKAE